MVQVESQCHSRVQWSTRKEEQSGGGGRMTYEFLDDDQLSKYAKEAVDQALINLEADEAPAGEMTVVLGSGWLTY